MARKKHLNIREIIVVLSILGFFILISFLVQKNLDVVEPFVRGYGIYGLLVYMFVLILEVVFAPISAIPIIPIISNTYGFFVSFIVTLIGNFIGSIVAFVIARKFGKPLVEKLTSLKELERFEKVIPQDQKFLGLIFIRILIPIDAINYFFGMFTKINFWTFFTTTFIGMIPGIAFLVYVGNIPVAYQITGLIIAVLVISFIWILIWKFGFQKFKNLIECYGFVCEK